MFNVLECTCRVSSAQVQWKPHNLNLYGNGLKLGIKRI